MLQLNVNNEKIPIMKRFPLQKKILDPRSSITYLNKYDAT